MIWSPYCIDETKGFVLQCDGSAKPNKLGRMVMTLKECDEYLRRRRNESCN